MKYFIILTFLLSSCVVRENRRCCAPSDCMPEPKKVIIKSSKIVTVEEIKERYIDYLDSQY